MAEGEPTLETASRLKYSRDHIIKTRKKVMRKLDACNPALAVRRGFEYGFLS